MARQRRRAPAPDPEGVGGEAAVDLVLAALIADRAATEADATSLPDLIQHLADGILRGAGQALPGEEMPEAATLALARRVDRIVDLARTALARIDHIRRSPSGS
jgi:hypothetical protein